MPVNSKPMIPLWRGFNLTDLYTARPGAKFREADFAFLAEWGFNFARLPLSYRTWSSAENPLVIDEAALASVDEAVAWGQQYGVHVNLAMHRIPGYCVNPDQTEPFQLFGKDEGGRRRALDAAVVHWRMFAARYQGIGPEQLSFNLLNEPPWMRNPAPYVAVVRELAAAIRSVDPKRLIFVDGAGAGHSPLQELKDEGFVQSTRGYLPRALTHYKANWVSPKEYGDTPTWPMRTGGFLGFFQTRWDRDRLRGKSIDRWQEIANKGVPVHVGEWGCYSFTPHRVALAWMRDMLGLWAEAGWGWALWNLRGPFGVLDSGRADAGYERLGEHLLDRAMLELLRTDLTSRGHGGYPRTDD